MLCCSVMTQPGSRARAVIYPGCGITEFALATITARTYPESVMPARRPHQLRGRRDPGPPERSESNGTVFGLRRGYDARHKTEYVSGRYAWGLG